MSKQAIILDFETQSAADLKKLGAWEYSVHPTTRVLCLSFKLLGQEKTWLFDYYTMEKPFIYLPKGFQKQWLAWVKDPDFHFHAHNHFFETCIMENVLVKRLGWPSIPIRKKRCTAAKAAAASLPRSLAEAGFAMRLAIQKDKNGYHAMMKLCKPTNMWNHWNQKGRVGPEPAMFWTPETAPEDFTTLYKYCKIDVLSEEDLDLKLPDLTPKEQELWFVDQKINLRGVTIDREAVTKILSIMKLETKNMEKKLDTITMGLVSSGNARAQILDFLTLDGIKLPNLQSKTVDDFLENGGVTGDMKELLLVRKALSKASVKKYDALDRASASDGRLRDLFLFCAATTGRWGGKGVQPQNLPRGVIKDIDVAIERIKTLSIPELKKIYGENLMPLFSSCLRGMFIASKGKELFVDDYNAIETRVLWWLADHEDGLKLFYDKKDSYWEMAKEIFKLPADLEYDENNLEHQAWRQVGKAAVLGCGYQMGAKKFMTAAWDVYRAKVDLSLAKVAVTSYREKHWPVPELWENVNGACIAAVDNLGKTYKVGRLKFKVQNNFLLIRLPSGRCLFYPEPKVKWRTIVVPEETEEVKQDDGTIKTIVIPERTFTVRAVCFMAVNSKTKKWTEETNYGGKWVENIVQAVSRDLLAEAMVRAEKAGYAVLMHAHDEMVCEKTIGEGSLEEYQQIMTTLPDWADGLPLKSKPWSGPRYKK